MYTFSLVGLLILLQIGSGEAACQHGDVIINPWPDNAKGDPKSLTISGLTRASLTGSNTTDHLDASRYVSVAINASTRELTFAPMHTMFGIRDYRAAASSSKLVSTCNIRCGAQTGSFTLTVLVTDANTAAPEMKSSSYKVDVPETLPTGFSLRGINIAASDADSDNQNNALTFTLDDNSVFDLSAAERTTDQKATYTSQLRLKKALDWSVKNRYELTVTAQDQGGLKSSASIVVTVSDVDNKQPEFSQSVYTAEVQDATALGPLDVDIQALDPDTGGPLSYELTDPVQDHWLDYFDVTSAADKAVLSLTQDVTDRLQETASTVNSTDRGQGEEWRVFLSLRDRGLSTSKTRAFNDHVIYDIDYTSDLASTTSPTTTPTTTRTTAPTPEPCHSLLFGSRELRGSAKETYNGSILIVTADAAVGPVTYVLLTPGYDEYFKLDETLGELRKISKLDHQTVALLVQGVYSGNELKNQTNNTNVVAWDEVLLIIDITDENDHRPVLSTSAQTDSVYHFPIVGYRNSPNAGYPQMLVHVTATDGDTGVYGSDGVVFSADEDFVNVDEDGIVYLIKEPSSDSDYYQRSFIVTGKDNNGDAPFRPGYVQILIVPFNDQQLYYITSDNQLTNRDSVTSLLDDVRKTGGYEAVYAYSLPTMVEDPHQGKLLSLFFATDNSKSQLVIYAIKKRTPSSKNEFEAVEKKSMESTISKMKGTYHIEFDGTQEEHKGCTPAPEDTSRTALIAVAVVLGVLFLLVVVVSITVQLRSRRRRRRSASDLEPLRADSNRSKRLHTPAETKDEPAVQYGGPPGFSESSPDLDPNYKSASPAAYNNACYVDAQDDSQRGNYNMSNPDIQENAFTTASAPVMEEESAPSYPPMTDTLPPTDSSPPPIHKPHAPSPPIHKYHAPSPPITHSLPSTEPMSVQLSSPEPISTPDEPVPDYSTKTVGFNETVVCLQPEEAEEEAEDEAAEEMKEGNDVTESPENQVTPSSETAEEGTSHGAEGAAASIYPSLDGMEKSEEYEVDQL